MALGEHGASAARRERAIRSRVYLAGRGEARAGDWPMISLSPRLTRIPREKTAAIRGGSIEGRVVFLSFFFGGRIGESSWEGLIRGGYFEGN